MTRKTKLDGDSNPNSPDAAKAIPGKRAMITRRQETKSQGMESSVCICALRSLCIEKKSVSTAPVSRKMRSVPDTTIT